MEEKESTAGLVDRMYRYPVPKEWEQVKASIIKLSKIPNSHMHMKRAEPQNQKEMNPANVFLIEALSAKITKTLGVKINSVDLSFILWMRDYEYVSRMYVVQSLMFLTEYTSYLFFQRLKKNEMIEEVRTRTIGTKNGSTFYLSEKGKLLADEIYRVLTKGDLKYFMR